MSQIYGKSKKIFWKRSKRGDKELIIEGSTEQSLRIAKARKMWYSTLYDTKPASPNIATGVFHPDKNLVQIITLHGKLLSTLGFSHDRSQWLYIEEALSLVESSKLSVTYKGEIITIQHLYYFMIRSGLPLTAYSTYSYFHRYDYILLRSTTSINASNSTFEDKLDILCSYVPGERDQWHGSDYHPWRRLRDPFKLVHSSILLPYNQIQTVKTIDPKPIPQIDESEKKALLNIDFDNFSMKDLDSLPPIEPLVTVDELNKMSKETFCYSVRMIEQTQLVDLFFQKFPSTLSEDKASLVTAMKAEGSPLTLQTFQEKWKAFSEANPKPEPSEEVDPSVTEFLADPQGIASYPFTASVFGDPTQIPVSRPEISSLDDYLFWDVYRPSEFFRQRFKKSKPGDPHFRLVIAPYHKAFPTLVDIARLTFASFPVPIRYAVTDSGNIISFDLIEGDIKILGTNPALLKRRATFVWGQMSPQDKEAMRLKFTSYVHAVPPPPPPPKTDVSGVTSTPPLEPISSDSSAPADPSSVPTKSPAKPQSIIMQPQEEEEEEDYF